MREQIAVLDGLGMLADGGYGGREFTPEAGAGANYGGGSNWHPYNPTLPSSEGLAGALAAGGLSNALSIEPSYAGREYQPEAGGGANYGGGSNWHPYNPTVPSSEGLAGGLSIESVPGYAGRTVTPVPGGGANYTGGSDWSRDFPTAVSSRGLVGVRNPLLRTRNARFDTTQIQIRSWVRCAVGNALALLYGAGSPYAIGDRIGANVERIVSLDFPRSMARTRTNVVYAAALDTILRHWFGVRGYGDAEMRRARPIALRVVQMCG